MIRNIARLTAVIVVAFAVSGTYAQSWSASGDLSDATSVLALIQTSSGRILAGTGLAEARVFRSDNGGASWSAGSRLGVENYAFSLFQAKDGTIYVGTYPGGLVFQSTDDGATWNPTATKPSARAEGVMAFVEGPDGSLWAGLLDDDIAGIGEIYATTNGGDSWTLIAEFDGYDYVHAFWKTPDNAILVGLGSHLNGPGGVRKTVNGGASFAIGTGVDRNSYAFTQGLDGTLYDGTYLDGIYRSTDGGDTWDSAGLAGNDYLHSLLASREGVIFAGARTGSLVGTVYTSSNGVTWHDSGPLPGAGFVHALLQTSDGFVYAGTGDAYGDVFKYGPITAIELVSFTATGGQDQVELAWETATESDNAGFRLWRADSATGTYARIMADMIPSEGDPTHGSRYAFTDDGLTAGKSYWYKLEDVDLHGQSTFHGPVGATVLRKPPFGCGMAGGSDGS